MSVALSSTTQTQQPKRRSGQIRLTRMTIMKGRILVDVPEHGLICGEFAYLPDDLGKQLEADGRFDTQAPFSDVVTEKSIEQVHTPKKNAKRLKSS